MKFTLEPQRLIVSLSGTEKLLSFKNHLMVDRHTITDLSWHPSFDAWRKLEIRLPGTGAPGALIAGSFWTPEGWDFVYVRRPHGFFKPRAANVLVIENSLNKYRRIVLSCSEKQAQTIITWWRS